MLVNFIICTIIAFVIAVISFKIKFLTKSGSIATFLLAAVIFSFGGLKWSLPILSFFILSSILSKIRKKQNEKVETYFEKSGTRDHMQVIANGGIGAAVATRRLGNQHICLFFPSCHHAAQRRGTRRVYPVNRRGAGAFRRPQPRRFGLDADAAG